MKNATGPAKEPKSKREMKPSETAMMAAEETSPSAGCGTGTSPR